MKNEFEKFYGDHLKAFGVSARGVGWKNEEAQEIRFEQLIKVIDAERPFSVNDLGCGVGDFVGFLNKKKYNFTYQGYDLLQQMIDYALARYEGHSALKFHTIRSAGDMEKADYTIASGIFNIRFAESDAHWLSYILDTLSAMNEKSTSGFAFNALTKYSDPELMKEDLYYADPGFLFDHCKRNFSKNVALLHDYKLYDFTILVRKN